MKLVLLALLVLVVLGAAVKATGNQLPILDYPLGPFGAPLIGPRVEIEPPGYDINMP